MQRAFGSEQTKSHSLKQTEAPEAEIFAAE